MPITELYSPNETKMRQAEARAASGLAPSAIGNVAMMSRISIFGGLPAEEISRLLSHAHWQVYAAGELVVDAGEPTDEVFFIMEGSVRVVVRTTLGYEAILNDLVAGEFFGEIAAIDGIPRSANVTALSKTRLCVVSGAAFMEAVLSSREIGRRLLRLMSMRVRAKDERLIEFSVLSVRQRLIAELLRLSRDRGGGERVLSPPPPQHILAGRIGTRRESVSRELADMSRAGLLTVGRRAIVLHQPARLRAEVEARMQGRGSV